MNFLVYSSDNGIQTCTEFLNSNFCRGFSDSSFCLVSTLIFQFFDMVFISRLVFSCFADFLRIPYLETQKLDYCQSYKDRAHAEQFCYQLISSHFNLLRIFQSAILLPYLGLFGRTSAS